MNLFASNHLAKVEPVASELEKAADNMEAAGIGGHPTRGHVAIAREMAADIRANAAKGVLPSAFDQLYAAADVHAASGRVKVSAADVEQALGSVAGFSAPLRAAVISAMELKGIISNDVNQISAAASRKTTINSIMASTPSAQPALKLLMAQCRRLGFELQPDKQVSLAEFDEAVKGKDVSDRWAAKLSMKRFGLI